MKIICDTTFLDGTDRFEAGDVRTVSDERGAYFVANGWAHAEGEQPAPQADAAPVDLALHSTRHVNTAKG